MAERIRANVAASQRASASSKFDAWAKTFSPSQLPSRASVAFEARLPKSMYPGVPARNHFREANTQLLRAMDADSGFAKMMDGLIPGIRNQLVNPRSISTKPPKGWTWHHAVGEGRMQLIPSIHHWDSNLWPILHPPVNGQMKGGMSIWGGGY